MYRQAITLVPNSTNWFPSGGAGVFKFTLYVGQTVPSDIPNGSCYVDSLYDNEHFRIVDKNGTKCKTAASNIYTRNGIPIKSDIFVLLTSPETKLYIEYGSDVTDSPGFSDLYNISTLLTTDTPVYISVMYSTTTSTVVWSLCYPITHVTMRRVGDSALTTDFYTYDENMVINSGDLSNYTNGKDVIAFCEFGKGKLTSYFSQHTRSSPLNTTYCRTTKTIPSTFTSAEKFILTYSTTTGNVDSPYIHGYYQVVDVTPVFSNPDYVSILSSTDLFGHISPEGLNFYDKGSDISFIITSTSGAYINSILVDGELVDIEEYITEYDYFFENVQTDHTISSTNTSLPDVIISEFSYNIFEFTVSFTDLSVGNPNEWYWSFGDGNHSSDQNPSHTYASPGTYTVTLWIRNNVATGTSSQDISVSGNCILSASISTNAIVGAVPFTVNFIGNYLGYPESYDWDFGDGSEHGSDANATHTYTADGSYIVTLTATAEGCESGIDTQQIIAYTPSINFVISREYTIVGEPLTFTNTSVGFDETDEFVWAVTDGSTYTGLNYEWSPSIPGTFTVTVSCNGYSKSRKIYVISDNFNYSIKDKTVTFTNISDKYALSSFSWDFDDGYNSSQEGSVKHTYAENGVYHVTLAHYCGIYTLVTSKIINIIDAGDINFSWSPKFVAQYYPVQFNNLSEVEE